MPFFAFSTYIIFALSLHLSSYCICIDFVHDVQVLEEMIKKGKLDYIRAIDLSHTVSLSENAIYQFVAQRGRLLEGLMVCGKPKLAEQFFLNIIPFVKKIR